MPSGDRRQETGGRRAAPASEPEGVRLQKIIAAAGVASRRAAETLMREGRVTVNGVVVSALGARAEPETDDIRVDGRRVGRVGRPGTIPSGAGP